ncbi:MAG TPA: RcnB family protein [Sphingomicrobium sp.]|jgi:hypothetical protein|nr:RcnB family protein [Sphingomicrobium sp.]
MRKMLLLLLLAGAATPALAQRDSRDDSDNKESTRAERQQAREEARAQRADRAERVVSRDRGFSARAAADVDSASNSPAESGRRMRLQQQVVNEQSDRDDSPRERRRASSGPRMVQPDFANGGGDSEPVRAFDGNRRSRDLARRRQIDQAEVVGQSELITGQGQAPSLRQSDRATPNVMRVRNRTPLVSERPREGTQPPLRAERHRRDRPNWSTSWRHSNKYDWHNWRKRHRSLFRLGFYFDPFGWRYRPYSIGWRLWPSYYSSRFWINDPWRYRLPYAPPGYRWIRYYNDAILVDTWNGEVVDVIYNFFW